MNYRIDPTILLISILTIPLLVMEIYNITLLDKMLIPLIMAILGIIITALMMVFGFYLFYRHCHEIIEEDEWEKRTVFLTEELAKDRKRQEGIL